MTNKPTGIGVRMEGAHRPMTNGLVVTPIEWQQPASCNGNIILYVYVLVEAVSRVRCMATSVLTANNSE